MGPLPILTVVKISLDRRRHRGIDIPTGKMRKDFDVNTTKRSSLILSLAIIMLAGATTVSAETKGWGVGAGVADGDFAIQARKDFWLGGDISQITGQAGVAFKENTTFLIDADYHFFINPGQASRFYPLAGLQFGFNSDDAKLGVNLGGGVNFMFTEKLAGFVEVKYVLWGFEGFALNAGLYF